MPAQQNVRSNAARVRKPVRRRGAALPVALQFAWRNLWRNPRRTWLTAGGMAFAVLLLTFSRATQDGSFQLMVDNGARLFTGHLQVQPEGYADNPTVDRTLRGVSELIERLRAADDWQAVSARAQAFALASAGEQSFGALIVGVEPAVEAGWLVLARTGLEGRFLRAAGENADAVPEAFVGAVLAQNLGVTVGDELVLLGAAKGGGVAAAAVTLVGTFASGQAELDRSLVMIPIDAFRGAWGLGADEAHLVVALMPRFEFDAPARRFDPGDGAEALYWADLMPEAEQMIAMKAVSTQLFFALMAVVVTFSVVASFMMIVFERMPEFAVLTATGMRPGVIMLMLQIEALWLALLGVLIGLGLSGLAIGWTASTGIPMPVAADDLLARFNIPDRIYPAFNTSAAWQAALVMLLGGQVAAAVPGLRLRRLQPVAAMREGG